jgi:hypothetical protein
MINFKYYYNVGPNNSVEYDKLWFHFKIIIKKFEN